MGVGNNGWVSDLIDTTEMYLRTIYELVEEGIVPLRARIAERLHQSGPTVSQTVARMERDGLVTVEGDRHLQLTDEGHGLATRVMRKHRLAERLLTDVIGLEWELVHEEACRWEHVMSRERRAPADRAARTIRRSRRTATRSRASASWARAATARSSWTASSRCSRSPTESDPVRVRVRRICEEMQKDETLMGALRRVGALPGCRGHRGRQRGGRAAGQRGETAEIVPEAAEHIFVTPRLTGRPPISWRATCGSHSLQPSSTLYVARSSPRVTPRLTMTTGIPALAA